MEVMQLLLLICIVFKSCPAWPITSSFEEITHLEPLPQSWNAENSKQHAYETESSESLEDYDVFHTVCDHKLQQTDKESVPNQGKEPWSVVEIQSQSMKNSEELGEVNPEMTQLHKLDQKIPESDEEQSHESPIQQTQEHKESVLKQEKESPLVSENQSQSTMDTEKDEEIISKPKYLLAFSEESALKMSGKEIYDNAKASYVEKLKKDLKNEFFNSTINYLEKSKGNFILLCARSMLNQMSEDVLEMVPVKPSQKYMPDIIFIPRIKEHTKEICDDVIQKIKNVFEYKLNT